MTNTTTRTMEVHGSPTHVITIQKAAIEAEIEMLRDMLETPLNTQEVGRNLDNLRGQIGMLRKILRGGVPSRKAPPEKPVRAPDEERGAIYGGT